MSRGTGKAKERGPRSKKLATKKVAIKDLQPKKDVKGGVEPINANRLRTR
jgi:hypothetical protein